MPAESAKAAKEMAAGPAREAEQRPLGFGRLPFLDGREQLAMATTVTKPSQPSALCLRTSRLSAEANLCLCLTKNRGSNVRQRTDFQDIGSTLYAGAASGLYRVVGPIARYCARRGYGARAAPGTNHLSTLEATNEQHPWEVLCDGGHIAGSGAPRDCRVCSGN